MVSAPAAPATLLRIVLAESDGELRRVLRDALEHQAGHTVVGEAASGSDMVRTVLTLEPQLVVFDTQLPGCPGLDALQQISDQMEVAAVALTGDRDLQRLLHCVETYDLAYLVKPVQPHQLAPTVLGAWTRFEHMRRLRSENATLRRNLENRKVIERAKGVLMKRYRLSEAEAYRRLQREAMNERTPMVKLAQAVLEGTQMCVSNNSPCNSGLRYANT